ncbi:MarR family winged helix-turn-helix transcriptional regulator [Ochrobactrum teleogrylli]|uniref:Winged helix-turn-helix transcriptional regulator n=2 Tax=Ochrobactrum TaxID=528 RepID=A0ABY2YAC2_9HYPH|nr:MULTISPECIES: MarR family winged helix-turn-helix transcriptional regulator [Brucella]NNU61851.1 winged helix-turn-helix transcriptional regulator [[Ochrobactrum] soli]TNV18060.1 winged helix-turn-helix transcriptional regulator [[Ochrobactrum] teleogrylli]
MAFELDSFLPYQLSVVAQRISERFSRRYAAEAGLTIPEWRVLAHLYRSGEVSIRDINTRVNLDKSIVSRAATRLESAGLLHKSDNNIDRRLIVLALTPKGEELMHRLGKIADEFQAEILKELGPDAGHFLDGLARLSGAHPAR